MSLGLLTATEQKLLANAWQCMDGQPNIDFVKLAEAMGHTNKRTTQNMMGIVRKKLAAADGNIIPLSSSAPTTPTKASSGRKAAGRKRKAVGASDGDAVGYAEGSDGSPVGKQGKGVNGASPAKPRNVKMSIKQEEQEEDEAEAGESLHESEMA